VKVATFLMRNVIAIIASSIQLLPEAIPPEQYQIETNDSSNDDLAYSTFTC